MGDWNGDSINTAGVYRAGGSWFLRNTNATGFADLTFGYAGVAGDIPITGDWNGDGIDTIGVVRNAAWFLRNTNTAGFADINFGYGANSDTPLVWR